MPGYPQPHPSYMCIMYTAENNLIGRCYVTMPWRTRRRTFVQLCSAPTEKIFSRRPWTSRQRQRADSNLSSLAAHHTDTCHFLVWCLYQWTLLCIHTPKKICKFLARWGLNRMYFSAPDHVITAHSIYHRRVRFCSSLFVTVRCCSKQWRTVVVVVVVVFFFKFNALLQLQKRQSCTILCIVMFVIVFFPVPN